MIHPPHRHGWHWSKHSQRSVFRLLAPTDRPLPRRLLLHPGYMRKSQQNGGRWWRYSDYVGWFPISRHEDLYFEVAYPAGSYPVPVNDGLSCSVHSGLENHNKFTSCNFRLWLFLSFGVSLHLGGFLLKVKNDIVEVGEILSRCYQTVSLFATRRSYSF